MPCSSSYEVSYKVLIKLRELAKKQVLEKFPNIIIGSSGYNRAFDIKYKSLYKNRYLYI